MADKATNELVEENKALIRRFVEEFWNAGDTTVVDELIAPDCIAWDQLFGPEGFKQLFDRVRASFPDLHFTIEDLFADQDKVALRFVERGTHEGEWIGIAPTHKQIAVPGIAIFRIANSKIAHQWVHNDFSLELEQLGGHVVAGENKAED